MTRGATQERPSFDPLLRRAREETSLLAFANVLLRHRRLIGACTLVGGLVVFASTLGEQPYYSTRVQFTARGAPSGLLAGIAAQYGLSIVGSDPSQSIEFYEDLLKSTELLRQVAKREYQVRTPNGMVRGTLPVLYQIHAGSREAEINLAALELRDHILTNATRRTGLVTFFVSTAYPDLTQQAARNMVSELDVYNTERRRSQITAERTFIEQRLAESSAALARAENDLRGFRDLNREYLSSPTLSLENDRLNREVTMRQQLYTSLSQAYEQARIEEVRDTPAITIVEPPDLPSTSDVGYRLRNRLLGAIAGMLLGIVLAFVRERVHETEVEGSRTFAAYSELKRATMRDLARPWRPVGRLFRASGGP